QTLQGLSNSKALRQLLHKHEPIARKMVTDKLVEQIVERMNPDVRGELVSAWGKYGQLAEAAQSTLEHPGTSEDVALATQQVTSVHPYTAQIKINGIPLSEFQAEIKYVFTLAQLFARVREGRLVALVADKSNVQVSATLMGEPIFSATYEINLHAQLDL